MYIGIAVNVNTGMKYHTHGYSSRYKAKTAATKLKGIYKQPGETIVVMTRLVKLDGGLK